MTDSSLPRFLGMKKPKTAQMMDDEEHEEDQRAFSRLRQVREEARIWKRKAENAEADLAQRNLVFQQKMVELRQEFEGTVVGLRQETDLRKRQVEELDKKLEHYHERAFELAAAMRDLELIYNTEIDRMKDAATHAMQGFVAAASTSAAALKARLDDLHMRMAGGEYRPKTVPTPKEPLPEMDQGMKELVQTRLAPKESS